MLTKLLVAIDGSEQSFKGVELALELAQKTASEVMLLEVVPIIPVYGSGERKLRQEIDERDADMTAEAEANLAIAGKKFVEQKIPYKAEVVIGDPAEEICRIAEKEQISMIIIGTHGRTGINRFLMGSVSSKVVTHAHCSVLVTR